MDESRGRAWRRFKTRAKSRKNRSINQKQWIPEKNWKMMYTRSDKLRRARQLGIEYPKRTIRQIIDYEQPLDK